MTDSGEGLKAQSFQFNMRKLYSPQSWQRFSGHITEQLLLLFNPAFFPSILKVLIVSFSLKNCLTIKFGLKSAFFGIQIVNISD